MDLLYTIPEKERNADGLRKCLPAHPEIRFASLTGVDLGGNDTDEKIPTSHFLEHIEEYLSGGVQTDGSSVVLPGIATLNDGKVDLIADPGVRWYIDYNNENRDPVQGFPLGTLRIPSFLKHRDRFIDSRAILKQTVESIGKRLAALLAECPEAARQAGVDPAAQPVEEALPQRLLDDALDQGLQQIRGFHAGIHAPSPNGNYFRIAPIAVS